MRWLNAIKELAKTTKKMYLETKNAAASFFWSFFGLGLYLAFFVFDVLVLLALVVLYSPLEMLGFMQQDSDVNVSDSIRMSKIMFNAIGMLVFSPMLFACFAMLIPVAFLTFAIDIGAFLISSGSCRFDTMRALCGF